VTAKIKRILTVAFCILWSAVLAIVPLAWFAGYWSSASSLDLRPGGNANLPTIEVFKYISRDELAMMTDEEKNLYGTAEGWWPDKSPNAPTLDSDSFTIAGAAGSASEGNDPTYTFVNPKLHFGRVDNLISLQPDNIIYIRLTVTSKISGGIRVNLDFINPQPTVGELYEATTLYGITPGSSTGIKRISTDTLKTLVSFPGVGGSTADTATADISNSYCQFMQISVCVTTSTLKPGDNGFNTLVFDNFNGDSEEFDMIGGDQIEIDETELRAALGLTAAEDPFPETYYVYLKIAPRLEFFVLQEHLLDQFVPSYMFFDTKLEIELH